MKILECLRNYFLDKKRVEFVQRERLVVYSQMNFIMITWFVQKISSYITKLETRYEHIAEGRTWREAVDNAMASYKGDMNK